MDGTLSRPTDTTPENNIAEMQGPFAEILVDEHILQGTTIEQVGEYYFIVPENTIPIDYVRFVLESMKDISGSFTIDLHQAQVRVSPEDTNCVTSTENPVIIDGKHLYAQVSQIQGSSEQILGILSSERNLQFIRNEILGMNFHEPILTPIESAQTHTRASVQELIGRIRRKLSGVGGKIFAKKVMDIIETGEIPQTENPENSSPSELPTVADIMSGDKGNGEAVVSIGDFLASLPPPRGEKTNGTPGLARIEERIQELQLAAEVPHSTTGRALDANLERMIREAGSSRAHQDSGNGEMISVSDSTSGTADTTGVQNRAEENLDTIIPQEQAVGDIGTISNPDILRLVRDTLGAYITGILGPNQSQLSPQEYQIGISGVSLIIASLKNKNDVFHPIEELFQGKMSLKYLERIIGELPGLHENIQELADNHLLKVSMLLETICKTLDQIKDTAQRLMNIKGLDRIEGKEDAIRQAMQVPYMTHVEGFTAWIQKVGRKLPFEQNGYAADIKKILNPPTIRPDSIKVPKPPIVKIQIAAQ